MDEDYQYFNKVKKKNHAEEVSLVKKKEELEVERMHSKKVLGDDIKELRIWLKELTRDKQRKMLKEKVQARITARQQMAEKMQRDVDKFMVRISAWKKLDFEQQRDRREPKVKNKWQQLALWNENGRNKTLLLLQKLSKQKKEERPHLNNNNKFKICATGVLTASLSSNRKKFLKPEKHPDKNANDTAGGKHLNKTSTAGEKSHCNVENLKTERRKTVIQAEDFWIGEPQAIFSIRRPRLEHGVTPTRHDSLGEVRKTLRDLTTFPYCTKSCVRPGAELERLASEMPRVPSLRKGHSPQ